LVWLGRPPPRPAPSSFFLVDSPLKARRGLLTSAERRGGQSRGVTLGQGAAPPPPALSGAAGAGPILRVEMDFYAPLLDTETLAARASLSPRTLQSWRSRGRRDLGPPWIQTPRHDGIPGHLVRYPRAEAEQWLVARRARLWAAASKLGAPPAGLPVHRQQPPQSPDRRDRATGWVLPRSLTGAP